MPKVFKSLQDPELTKLINNGAVGILPTDTVYGLVCRADNQPAAERLYKLKSRSGKPGTLIAASKEQLTSLGFKMRYLKAVEQYWPNPISIEIPSSDPQFSYLRQNQPTMAVRIPADKKVISLLGKVGPLLTTSANAPGEEPSDTVQEAKQFFKDNVDFYVDVGSLKGHRHSTIIRVVDDAVEVVRQGAVKIDDSGVAK